MFYHRVVAFFSAVKGKHPHPHNHSDGSRNPVRINLHVQHIPLTSGFRFSTEWDIAAGFCFFHRMVAFFSAVKEKILTHTTIPTEVGIQSR